MIRSASATSSPTLRFWLRSGVAAAGLAATLLLLQGAHAQEIPMFEHAPSLETLRGILIPESTGGASRRIILPRRDEINSGSPAQPAAAMIMRPMPSQAETATPAAAMPMRSDKPAEAAPHAKAMPAAVAFRIDFALNSTAIPDAADPFLDRLAELMKEEPKVRLVVEGHTDGRGSDQYNLQLSAQRAKAVGLALIQRGVPKDRLAMVGKGKSEPLVPDLMDSHNRRVQFVRADGGSS